MKKLLPILLITLTGCGDWNVNDSLLVRDGFVAVVVSVETKDTIRSVYTVRFKKKDCLDNELKYTDTIHKFVVGDTLNFLYERNTTSRLFAKPLSVLAALVLRNSKNIC